MYAVFQHLGIEAHNGYGLAGWIGKGSRAEDFYLVYFTRGVFAFGQLCRCA